MCKRIIYNTLTHRLTTRTKLSLFGEENNFENRKASSRIRTRTEIVTPEKAEFYLKNQNSNRNPSDAQINKLVAEMISGRWIQNGMPLLFDENDKLIDGQHRLYAVVKAKTPQSFVILSGYKTDVMHVLDIGKSRTAANIGQIKGLPINDTHVGCINAMPLPTRNRLSKTEVLSLFQKYNAGVIFACGYNPPEKCEHKLPAPLKALIAKAYYYESHDLLNRFMHVYTTGFSTNTQDRAVIALLNHVLKVKASLTHEQRVELYTKGQSALQHFIARREVKSVHRVLSVEDRYPLPDLYEMSEENLRRFNKAAFDL